MGILDLHKVAVCMGKIIKVLSRIQSHIAEGDDVGEHKEVLCCMAYLCRVGILDMIQENSYMNNPNLKIRIPTGFVRYRKETMASALALTVGQLRKIANMDADTGSCVEEILNKMDAFYVYDEMIAERLRAKGKNI